MRTLIAATLLIVTLPVSPSAQPAPESLLVSTSWLADHLQDRDVVILWTGTAGSASEFIPGTHVVPHETVMTSQGGHDLLATEELAAVLRNAGVTNAARVVVYGEPMAAGWLFFALDYLGHERPSILDGGIQQWRAEMRPVAAASPSAQGDFMPRVRAAVKKTAADVQAQIKSGGVTLLDARSAQEYALGHIPTAKLLTWQDVFASPQTPMFKSREELRAMFAAAGVTPGAPVTAYCGVGLRASVLYFAAKYVGLDVANYVGSWSDWKARGLPTEP